MDHVSAALSARFMSFAGPVGFGHRSPLPEPDAYAALARIRALRGDNTLRLSFIAVSEDGFTDSYADDQGYEYRVRREDGALVEVDRQQDLHSKARPARPETRLPVAELRRIATSVIETQRPAFETIRSSLHPFEGNKDRELYLFRWEDFSRPLGETRVPPYIQVGLYADGVLARYADTLGKREIDT